MINGFYDKRDLKKEVVSEGFVEEEERLSRKKEDRQGRLPVFGGTPEQKVRKIFWKLVLAEYESRGKEKPDAALTARQFAGKLDDGSKTAQWEELAAIYEKARYSSESVSKEESRQASVLARQIKR